MNVALPALSKTNTASGDESSARVDLSIVSSLYRSEDTVVEFVRRAARAAASITSSFEIILVNDGSPDRVRERLTEILPNYPTLKVIDLSRNFGQLAALHAGLTYSRGIEVFMLDSDLEEPPEALLDFRRRLMADPPVDVVYGLQQFRQGPKIRDFTSECFYWVFQRMTGIPNLQRMMITRIMTRRFVDAYLSFGDFHLFVAGLSHHAGFDKATLLVDKSFKGSSGYTFKKRLLMASDAVLSFSTRPLYAMFFGSLFAAFILFTLAAALFVARVLNLNLAAGWASLIISIWFVGAIIVNCAAILGLYVAKIYEQVKGRPRYVVRQVYESRLGGKTRDYIEDDTGPLGQKENLYDGRFLGRCSCKQLR